MGFEETDKILKVYSEKVLALENTHTGRHQTHQEKENSKLKESILILMHLPCVAGARLSTARPGPSRTDCR